MRAVLQRVSRASVAVEARVKGEIGPGLLVLVAVGREDSAATAASMADKIVNLRIFNDEQGKMNRSLLDSGGRDSCRVAIHTLWRRARAEAAEFSAGCSARAREDAV